MGPGRTGGRAVTPHVRAFSALLYAAGAVEPGESLRFQHGFPSCVDLYALPSPGACERQAWARQISASPGPIIINSPGLCRPQPRRLHAAIRRLSPTLHRQARRLWAEQARLIDWQTQPQQICQLRQPTVCQMVLVGVPPTCATTPSIATWPSAVRKTRWWLSLPKPTPSAPTATPNCTLKCSAWPPACWRWASKQGDRVLIYMPMIC